METVINILSDTSGYATEQIVKQSLNQFDNHDIKINIYPNIRELDSLDRILKCLLIYESNQIIYHSFQEKKMNIYIKNFAEVHNINTIDIMSESIETIARALGKEPKSLFSKNSLYNTSFFKKFDAIDFALKYDDGKDFSAIKFCDIAIIGVSRSSKTPLSLYLASKGFRVANIPILLDSKIPKELFEIDPHKIYGLTVDENILAKFRKERLKQLNLSGYSQYTDIERIRKEINYSKEVMEDIGCLIIDTSDKALEEISEIILNNLKEYERSKE